MNNDKKEMLKDVLIFVGHQIGKELSVTELAMLGLLLDKNIITKADALTWVKRKKRAEKEYSVLKTKNKR